MNPSAPEAEIIPPGGLSREERLKRIEALAALMDSQFALPGTKLRIGLDGLLGLVPVVGDSLTLLASGYIVKLAHELGVPGHVKARMAGNIFLDWLIGLVPLVGDAFDIGWKANRRNAALVRRHVERSGHA